MVSPRKEHSKLTLIQEEPQERMMPSSTKSCESLYSNSSSSKGTVSAYRRPKNVPQAGQGKVQANANRQPTLISATTDVRQRVLSARRLRFATFQNQLADAQQTIAELAHENRILRTLHKRQDSALAKYESTNAELPKLLHSHAEELRVWQTKYRNLQQQFKDLEQKLKQKEALILQLSDQNKYYSQLNKDRNLEERQRLTEKLHQMETRLQEKDQDMKLLARKVQIEAKNFRQQVLNEQRRTKQALLKLEKTRLELSGYRKLDELELSDKFPSIVNRNRKSSILEETKLEKDLEKILEEEEKQEVTFVQSQSHLNTNALLVEFSQSQSLTNPNSLLGDDDPLASQRSSCSGNTTKLDNPTARTIRKSSRLDSNSTSRIQSASSVHRRNERGDGDASVVLSDFKQNSVRQKNFKLLKAEQQKKNKKKVVTPKGKTPKTPKKAIELLINEVAADYEDDYELIQNGDDGDEYNDISQGNDDDADNDDVVSNVIIPDCDDDDENGDSVEENDQNDSKDEDYINTAKQKKNMKDDISSIRKQLNEDYKEREAFLDTFCRQATSGVLLDESPKKRATMGQKLPSSRKNKLLAALKAIDDNKSQD